MAEYELRITVEKVAVSSQKVIKRDENVRTEYSMEGV